MNTYQNHLLSIRGKKAMAALQGHLEKKPDEFCFNWDTIEWDDSTEGYLKTHPITKGPHPITDLTESPIIIKRYVE